MKMHRKAESFLAAGAIAWLLGAGLLAGEWHRTRRAAHAARELWAHRLGERESLVSRNPLWSPARLAALAQAEAEVAQQRQSLVAAGATSPRPDTPLESWFEVSMTHDRLRRMAERAGVVLTPEERFGLDVPRGEEIDAAGPAAISWQCAATEFLLETLFAARPRALLSVRREAPPGAGARDGADFLRPEPGLSLRIPGVIDATAFRVEFTGRTAVLREFLEGVADTAGPWCVRSVEAAPVSAETLRGIRPVRAADPELRPVVVPGLTRFAVTVEHLALAAGVSR